MKLPLLNSDLVAFVDDADFELVSQYQWRLLKRKHTTYARAYAVVDGKPTTLLLHRLIMNPPTGVSVDHINHNGLDCQRGNLRVCTSTSSNNANARKRSRKATSVYKGVSKHACGKWLASIGHEHKVKYVGLYATEIEAAKAYDAKARELFGAYAFTNAAATTEKLEGYLAELDAGVSNAA